MSVLRRRGFAALALVACACGPADAGPNGGTVVGGSASIQGQGSSSVTINQSSQSAIINWATFNIGQGETTTFNQPNSSSVALNRVIGGQGPSFLDGTLTANGRVFVVNGDGILFGLHSAINTTGFLATTNDIRNQDFTAGRYNFSIPGLPNASVVNLGKITATSGGFAALVAPGVRNSGTITATLGTVALAAGNAFTLDFYGDKLITLAVNDQIASQVIDVATGQPLKSLVSNTGKLSANGGRVELTAAAARAVVDSVINNEGVIEANSIGKHNGMIVLSAATGSSKPAGAPTQTVKLSGKISAAGKKAGTTGGTVVVTGENIMLAGATIDASGQAGGGKVLIGGDTGGGNPSAAATAIELAKLESFVIPTATTVSVDATSIINASATGQGNGGKVVIWSNQQTTFAGTIFAKGGAAGGNGGFVETSSHQLLNYTGTVDLSAPTGTTGTLLLDPYNVTICICDPENGAFSSGSWVPTGTSIINVGDLEHQLLSANVLISTGGASPGTDSGIINVSAGLSWNTTSTLTLNAYNNINISYAISAPNGGLTLNAGNAISAPAAVNVATFTLQNGTWSQVSSSLPAFSATNFQFQGGTFLRALGGDGSSGSPYQITDVYGLQGIGSTSLLGQHFVLANNIEASGTANWNAGAGFLPVGNADNSFVGMFNGQSNNIDRLTINSIGQYNGLFGYIGPGGVVQNIGLTNTSVTGTGSDGLGWVGTLAGINAGTITQSYATGSISGALGYDIGGLIARNLGTIAQSYANVSTNGGTSSAIGGLVGRNFGTITQSYALGPANAGSYSYIGGLVGWNSSGTVSQSYATGLVSAPASNIGGLVGVNGGEVTSSYWDITTTPQANGYGTNSATFSATGLTTAQLQAGLPTGFDPTVWGTNATINNGLPILPWQGPAIDIITVDANPETKVYGNSDPTLTFTVIAGNLGSATFVGTLTRAPGENVGTYDIGEGTLSLPAGYQINFVDSSLGITPRPITVTANAQTMLYGSTAPPLTYVVGGSGLVNGDALTGLLATTATSTSNVGQYSITQGTLAASSNYAINYVGANLTVNPRPLTVTANSQDVIFGGAIPPLTYVVGGSGLVNGDTLDGSLATTATSTSPPGSYPITLGTLRNPNYAITYASAPNDAVAYFGAALTIIPPPTNTLVWQTQLQNQFGTPLVLASLTSGGEVVNIQALTQPQLPRQPQQGTGPAPGPGGLPPQFGNRFFAVPPPGETRFVKDEVVLQVPTNIPLDQLQAIMRRFGLTILGSQTFGLLGVTTYRMHIGSGITVASVIRALASYGIIAGAQANLVYVLAQDVAQYPDLAGRTQEGDAAQYTLGKLGLIDIHRVVTGANITVAVIDSEIDVNHPDLDGVILEQFDAVGQVEKPHPHGTGMAGAIAAHRRLMGIAPSARLYAVHAFSNTATSAESTTFNILKGLDWAASKGVRVINMSFAGPRDPSLERALRAAHDKGIVLVAAAGNGGPKSPPLYPGADPNVIAVTATDVNDKVFSFANRGRYIAVAAPGVDILVPAPEGTYQLTTGTSVASAEVSGIVALLLERNPNLTPDDIRRILTSSAKHPGIKDRDDDYGYGLVDPSKAIQAAGELKPVGQPARR